MASATRLPGGQLVQPGRDDRARHVDHEQRPGPSTPTVDGEATVVLA